MPEGIKFDGDKARLAEMILDFKEPMEELCKVWTFGAFKYTKSNWKQLDNGIDRYTNALLRHLFAEQDNIYDGETHLYHAAHIAFNALARLYFIMKEQEELQSQRQQPVEVEWNVNKFSNKLSEHLDRQLKLPLEFEGGYDEKGAQYVFGTRCE